MPRLSKLSRSVAGRAVLVTGAARGMGRATAHLFADEGAMVAVTDLKQEAVDAVVKEITDAGGKAQGWVEVAATTRDDRFIVTIADDAPPFDPTTVPDPDLSITDRYDLRNPKNFALKTGVIVPLPIPTTILVDAAGTVRWIDQATDYMRRSDPDRVLAAIRAMDAEDRLLGVGCARSVM